MSATSTRPAKLDWLRRLVSGAPHQIIGPANNPYLFRWYVIPKNPWLKVYVHKFMRSDDERALHDHPWSFVSVILRGGYVEVSETADYKTTMLCRTSLFDLRSPFWRRCIAYRPAIYRHQVKLPIESGVEQSCWTLIITGPHVRTWGFWCPARGTRGERIGEWFVPWQQWGDAGCGD
jgi:hypothetical protein